MRNWLQNSFNGSYAGQEIAEVPAWIADGSWRDAGLSLNQAAGVLRSYSDDLAANVHANAPRTILGHIDGPLGDAIQGSLNRTNATRFPSPANLDNSAPSSRNFGLIGFGLAPSLGNINYTSQPISLTQQQTGTYPPGQATQPSSIGNSDPFSFNNGLIGVGLGPTFSNTGINFGPLPDPGHGMTPQEIQYLRTIGLY